MPKQSAEGLIAATILSQRVRISQIFESEAGIARPKLAAELALRSNLDVESAVAILRVAPEETASAATSFMRALAAESIGLNSLGTEAITDKKAARLAEIKTNIAPLKVKA